MEVLKIVIMNGTIYLMLQLVLCAKETIKLKTYDIDFSTSEKNIKY